jgi:hypothetical protein
VITTSFVVESPCARALEAIDFQYGEMRDDVESPVRPAPITVTVSPLDEPLHYSVSIDGKVVTEVAGLGHLLHEIDNPLAYRLQCQVPGLYFVHAACLARDGDATIIMGASGAGKSTAAYALSSAGLRYLSDELSPIDPKRREVLPYPRSICLKNAPPEPLRLPENYLHSEWTLHVAARTLGASVARCAMPLKRIVFLVHDPGDEEVKITQLSKSEASVRLYQNALNQLSHPSYGLDDTIRLVAEVNCYELKRAGVDGTMQALADIGVV